MSVDFSGWETTDDEAASPGVELAALQTPHDRGLYTMYHGTTVSSAYLIIQHGFRPSERGMLGKGVYVSRDRNKASCYPRDCSYADRVVLQVRVRVGRVKCINTDNHPWQYTWHEHGYDTAWVPAGCGMAAVPSGMEEDCVFDPDRVRVEAVVKAPDDAVMAQLRECLRRGQEGGLHAECPLCSRRTQHGSEHIRQQCWSCGANICILMHKHFCPAQA
ncbi:uncharacterized protein ACB057_004925 [Neosynchiropus ocellatus]